MPLINDADAIRLGDTPATRVYAGDVQVWPPGAYFAWAFHNYYSDTQVMAAMNNSGIHASAFSPGDRVAINDRFGMDIVTQNQTDISAEVNDLFWGTEQQLGDIVTTWGPFASWGDWTSGDTNTWPKNSESPLTGRTLTYEIFAGSTVADAVAFSLQNGRPTFVQGEYYVLTFSHSPL